MRRDPRASRNFSGFLVAFIVIIAVAFGVLAWAGTWQPKPVDNVAVPN